MPEPDPLIKKLGSEGLELVLQAGWSTRVVEYFPVTAHETPVENVRIAATGGGEDACYTVSDCGRVLRDIQREHIFKCGLEDIAYNFMIGGDGRVYEGRGWKFKPYRSEDYCAHVPKSVIDIVYIGDFNKIFQPPKAYKETMDAFIKYGVQEKYIKPDYEVHLDYMDHY